MTPALARHWPLYDLVLRTDRLVLRLPDEDDLAALADLAAAGVHAPGERPFLTPWTEGSGTDRARHVVQAHGAGLGDWSPASWRLGLGVFAAAEPVGMVTLRAVDFGVRREVSTSSWLGLAHHRRGFGTQARAALLTLGFDHLDAVSAVTEVFPANAASQGVSRALGYRPDGISRDARDGRAIVSDRLRLDHADWARAAHPVAEVVGLDRCRALFGA
ncbi:MAG: GNAT family protein [Lapillicoccus sp.]